jgi:hypothetical protein
MKRKTESSTDNTDGHREEMKSNEECLTAEDAEGRREELILSFFQFFSATLGGLCG